MIVGRSQSRKTILQRSFQLPTSSPAINILSIHPRSWFLPSILTCGTNVCPAAVILQRLLSSMVEGVQLTLDQLLQTGLFRFDPSTEFDKTTFGLSQPGSAFPLLSQGDHPVLGTRCWYFHPCESSAAVNELVNEVISPNVSEDDRLRCWMKMWFLVLGSVVNL